jgi:inorganic pyrophosphatase
MPHPMQLPARAGRGLAHVIIAVAITPVNKPTVRRIRDLPKFKLDELEHFFVNYNRVHGRIFKPLGRLGPAAAERMLVHAIHRQDG